MQEWHVARGTSLRTSGPEPRVSEGSGEYRHSERESADVPQRQKGNEGSRWQMAAMSEEGEDNHKQHQRVELRTAVAPGKQRNAQEDPICGFQREVCETSGRKVQRVMKNGGLDIVEESSPSKAVITWINWNVIRELLWRSWP
jgi:hypothetical protein